MDTYKILNLVKADAKKILYYAYRTSETFPASCGLVSGLLARIIFLKKLLCDYDIYYIRGLHSDRNMIPDECNLSRNIDKIPCNNCFFFCDGVKEHSWIEIIEKKTGKKIILDYTCIQFDEESILIEEYLYEESFDEDSLYDFLYENCSFIITEQNDSFQDYIPCYKQIKNGEEIEVAIQEMEDWYKRKG